MTTAGKTGFGVGLILAASRIPTRRPADQDPGFLVRPVPWAWETLCLYFRLFRTQIPLLAGISHGQQNYLVE